MTPQEEREAIIAKLEPINQQIEARHIEVADALFELGIFERGDKVPDAELESIALLSEKVESKYGSMSPDLATLFAAMDYYGAKAYQNGTTPQLIMSSLDPDLVYQLMETMNPEDLVELGNQEFIKTVLAKAATLYGVETSSVSDAVIQALDARVAEFRGSGVDLVVDTQTGFVLPKEESEK